MIADSPPLFLATFFLHFLLFVGAPMVLFRRGWPISGALISLASTLLPIGCQTWFTDSDSPGLSFLLMLELPIALLILVAAVVMASLKILEVELSLQIKRPAA
jgi:hypothetical protein